MSDLITEAGLMMYSDLGKTIKFTTTSGFHEYYELLAISFEIDTRVALLVRARKEDYKLMRVHLAAEQIVRLSDISNDTGLRE